MIKLSPPKLVEFENIWFEQKSTNWWYG